MAVVVIVVGASSLEPSGDPAEPEGGRPPSELALKDIPSPYLRLYREAALRYGLDWSILAGIGKVECDHGRDPDPSCLHQGSVNSAGAGGPMQFLATTWAQYGVDADRDGVGDRWDATDAIFGAANYLRSSGAPGNYRQAIFAYNHADWYVSEVESWAARYRGSQEGDQGALVSAGQGGLPARIQTETPTPVRVVAGDRAVLDPSDGHLALIPASAPPVVQAMLVAGNELQGLPYGPAGHPDPRGAPEEDCSSTLNYILYRAGIRPISEILSQNPLAQDYVHWGMPGPGRWVTIYATDEPTPHVFAVIAGLRIDTSHNGTDVGPNQAQDGPRWRILAGIPTWAHWSVRHPPGL
ncbi:MAG TPA: lytic transglycosylase domain-containing protein [Solirubrobacteraceae bacterium]|nr:lytic transglycosylase domain-containing protein [Solirubrobacteraceae bacterium]